MQVQPRALIVDDDDPIRTMLAVIVRQQGFAVDTARNGREAIDSLDRDGYSVVVLDLMMPQVDGYAVLRHMQEKQPALLSCTILATAMPEGEIRHIGDRVYMVHGKPFDLQRLIADVRRCGMAGSTDH